MFQNNPNVTKEWFLMMPYDPELSLMLSLGLICTEMFSNNQYIIMFLNDRKKMIKEHFT